MQLPKLRVNQGWSLLSNLNCSWSEQSRRESNGRKHRESMQVNAEIAGDNPQPRIKRGESVDKARYNQLQFERKMRLVHDDIRMRFGPRLVRHDGTAIYTFQCKK
jgi:hypothetical protein